MSSKEALKQLNIHDATKEEFSWIELKIDEFNEKKPYSHILLAF